MTALPLKAVFRLGLRQTEGLIGLIISLLGLTLAVPDYCTLGRRAEKLDVPRLRFNNTFAGEPAHLLVDIIGLKLYGAGEWLVEKYSTKTRYSWRKLHIGLDGHPWEVVAATLTMDDINNASQAGPLLGQAEAAVASVTGSIASNQDYVSKRYGP